MMRLLLATALSCAGVATIGCASYAAAQSPKSSFDGAWSVQWCDKTMPEADCGGFNISLSQEGDTINGDASGARARLSQIDEGGIIHGIAIGNTAILTIESLRSGGIYLVKATIEGRCMRWKVRDTIREPERDIDIIALDDTLTRSGNENHDNHQTKPHKRQQATACNKRKH